MIENEINGGKAVDVILIGAGIMSATLGMMIKELMPQASIEIFERLDMVAGESSDAWNNAGTGHAALCELNYTPEKENGTIDCKKALAINEAFDVSRQFWSWMVEQQIIQPGFINSVPHMSFVWGDDNVTYLKKRYEALTQYHPYKKMQYSEDAAQLKEWMPLVMEGRDPSQKIAATYMDIGTDVNFGELTRAMITHLQQQDNVTLHLKHEVRDIERAENDQWRISVKDLATKDSRELNAKFVFIGAGGGSLWLLEKSDIPEGKGFGGFPVGGQWLRCTDDAVIERHGAKVYGKAPEGAPPMSVPHLDTRLIEGKKALLFGPYAGFSTKFLKNGSYLDLPLSVKLSNIVPMISVGLKNIPLTRYLIHEVLQTPEDKLKSLQQFLPGAKLEDWDLEIAGQRVQVIKKDKEEGGVLEFGTEVVAAADGSLAALLGASPGASTSVSIMLGLIERCFPEKIKSSEWQSVIKKMIPSYGSSMVKNPDLCDAIRAKTSAVLGLVN
ncbi:malate:quinone oxidoreductase [Ferruginibacter paludis]|uniref:malate:quinone oxidoreductase n=1 Tax=Ferruginibacter paludis TaxID=1310417 RepID=UPI0025B596E0|nr:malate:quinone oxidoreductase [Ferruginibacter paludis]MDN3659432.1 malate:quinone oxidoreductase [Ferruginibacter paludis]